MVNICYCMEFPELPLGGNYEPDKFKLYFADTGLLVSMLDDESQEDLRANKNLGVYKGALYENMVGKAPDGTWLNQKEPGILPIMVQQMLDTDGIDASASQR